MSRWQRKDGSRVSPAVFIPMLEQAGLMDDFFIKMFSKVVDDIIKYGFIDSASPVFVNLSPELINSRFDFSRITDLLDQFSIPRDFLGFEITETSIASDVQRTDEIIDMLRNEGFQIALDDFGMGYSNLSQILNQSFHKVKFDKSFIENIFSNAKKLSLLESLLNFFNFFGYKTLIEGVETEEEYSLLQKFNFSEYQGFYFSKPLPPDKLTE